VIVTLNRLQYDKDIKFHIADYLYKKNMKYLLILQCTSIMIKHREWFRFSWL